MENLVGAFAGYLKEELMLQPRTIKQYRAVLDEFSAFVGRELTDAGVHLERITTVKLREFLRHRVNDDDEPSRSRWNLRLAALRSFYDYLYKRELIEANPARRVSRQREQPREKRPLSFDEMLALVDAAAGDDEPYRVRNQAIIQVLFHSALRVAELVSLNVDQVDVVNHVFRDVRTKGNKTRTVDFNDVSSEALEGYLEERRCVDTDDQALFLSNRKRRISIRAVQDIVGRTAARAGIARPVSPHVLRHTHASEQAAAGTPLPVIQRILGHGSIMTTQRYVHVSGHQRREAVDELSEKWKKKRRETGDEKP